MIRIQEQLHNRLLKFRILERMTSTKSFEILWKESDEDWQLAAEKCIETLDVEKLKEWISRHPSLPVEEWTLKDLKWAVQYFRVPGYSRMLKTELILAVKGLMKDEENRNVWRNNVLQSRNEGAISEHTQ